VNAGTIEELPASMEPLDENVLATLEVRLGPREDREPDARLFADSGADALRTSIAKACRAAGIPLFSPHFGL
jgi:hypothetical protein